MGIKINNSVFRLKHAKKIIIKGIPQPFEFRNGEEFHIIRDVVYMGGFPLPTNMQELVIKWIKDNPSLFINDTRNF